MEDLTKQQIILVALLVSFMTSISTGIVTVALVDQAPQGVTQTINQVVEKTIERVVPAETKDQSANVSGANIKTISTEEALPGAIEKASKSLVRIRGTVTLDPPYFMTMGVVVSKDGLIAAPRSLFIEGGTYTGTFIDGSKTDLELVARNEDYGTLYFRVKPKAGIKVNLSPIVFSDVKTVKIGTSVAVLSGEERTVTGRGIVTGLVKNDKDSLALVETDISYMRAMSPLINYQGEFVGLRSMRENDGGTVFVSSEEIRRQIDQTTLPAPKNAQ